MVTRRQKPTNTSFTARFDEQGFERLKEDIRRLISLYNMPFNVEDLVTGDTTDGNVLSSDGEGGLEFVPKTAPGVHASTHIDGGSDELRVEQLATFGAAGTVPTSNGAGALTMTSFPLPAHASNHEDGGSDEVTIENLPTGSTTTNHVVLSDGDGTVSMGFVAHSDATGQTTDDHHARDHASTHSVGGADPVTVENLVTAAPSNYVLTSDGDGTLSFQSNASALAAHASTHEFGGSDVVTLENLTTASNAGQIAVSNADGSIDMKQYYVVEPDDDLVTILNGLGNNSFVWLADGTHTAATQINISGDNIQVSGSEAAIIDVTYTGDNPIAITAPSSDVTFDGFSVLYNGGAGGQTPLFAPIGSGGDDINRLVVRNIHVDFNSGAITFVRADGEDIDVYGLTVEGCSLFGSKTKGLFRWPIAASRELKQVRLLGNRVTRDTAGGSQGIALYGNTSSLIDDVIIQGNSLQNLQEQIWFNDNVGVIQKVVINGNVFTYDGSGNAGPEIVGSGISDIIITNNSFDNAGDEHCLLLDSGTRFKVSNNIFINSNKDGLKIGSGLTDSTVNHNTATSCGENGIDNQGDNIDIRNNTCRDNTGYGIAEPSATDGCNYFGNNCEDNTAGDYSLHSSSTNRTRFDREANKWEPEGLYVEDLVTDGNSGYVATSDGNGDVYMGDVAVNFDRIVTDQYGNVVVADTTGNVVWV